MLPVTRRMKANESDTLVGKMFYQMPSQFNKIGLKVRLILIKRRWQSRFLSLIRCTFQL